MASLSACHHPVETVHAPSLQPELVSIDSLMQTRPDSALTMLLDSPMDDHYYQLLLSEALYKNDSAQLNRNELLHAVAYFDSIGCPFLSARVHYINGVGYYEMDSVVYACEEYLKALEIMEEHFEEKDLVGYKAKLVALAYSHLCLLFTDQYLHVQAVGFAKKTYEYYQKLSYSSWQSAWALNKIGLNYHMMEQLDSAAYYYQRAANALDDTTNLMYRDICSHQVSIEYELTGESERALLQLKRLLFQAESEKEYFARCLPLGEVFYHEQKLDSTVVYLEKVFFGNASVPSKKQAAEWLVEIHNEKGESIKAQPYADYLVPFANQEENKSEIKSRLTELYGSHIKTTQENSRRYEVKQHKKRMLIALISFTVLLLLSFFFYHKTRKRHQKIQLEDERRAHEIKQKALRRKLQVSNEALCVLKKKEEKLLQELNVHQNQRVWGNLNDFMEEDVCQEILRSLQKVNIKREVKSDNYPQLWLDENQISRLMVAVEKHFHGFCNILIRKYPKINHNEIVQCLLSLLNIKDVQIAALLHCDYSTINKRSIKLKKAFGTNESIQVFVRELVL